MKNIMIAGGGVLGSQIAFQCAYAGLDVAVWLRSEESVQRAKKKMEELTEKYQKTIFSCKYGKSKYLGALDAVGTDMKQADFDLYSKKAAAVMKQIHFETDLEKAASGKEFIVESITENVEIKKDFYSKLNEYVSDDAVIATNTSSFLPSTFADIIKKPERFIAVHFANNIWIANIAEIMGHAGTSENTEKKAIEFAESINMIPSVIRKETKGYILNSLLIPFLISALKLWGGEIADFQSIDNTWKLSTASRYGAFEIMDMVGVKTVYAVVATNPLASQEGTLEYTIAEKLKDMIAKNENFYKS